MAVTKISNSGIKTGVLKYDSFLAGNAAYDPAATWLIQRVNGTGSSTAITFSSIPQTYQHLQIRAIMKNAYTANANVVDNLYMTFNSLGGTNYAYHSLYNNNSAVGAQGQINTPSADLVYGVANNAATRANMMSVAIIDIHDYASTTKNKTIRTFNGCDYNGFGTVELNSGLLKTTSAITSITLTAGFNWLTTTSFALYGFTGA